MKMVDFGQFLGKKVNFQTFATDRLTHFFKQ